MKPDFSENHVFVIDTNRYYSQVKDSYEGVLTEQECKKALKFLRIEDYRNYVARKYFIRKLLAVYLGESPQEITFQLSAQKKPYIEGIEFNVSHSAEMAVVALSKAPVGIDIEFVKADFSYHTLLVDCFDSKEQDAIHRANDQLLAFYTLWTRKEALLKASGDGLVKEQLNKVNILEDKTVHHHKPYHLFSSLLTENYIMSTAFTLPSIKTHYWNV